MFFSWRKNRRRRKLRAQPFPNEWLDMVQRNLLDYGCLTAAEQTRLQGTVRIVVAEKHWEGCGGLQIDDEMRVTIAAQIALLVLGFDRQYFDHVQSILVYPNAYIAPGRTITKGGVILEGDSAREGEAWYRGPVVLSWADVLAGGQRRSGADNLIYHEFAHQLDMLNGQVVDGTPNLETAEQYRRWSAVVSAHYDQLKKDCRKGRLTLLDCYGATSPGEFFAVATETFFQRPVALRRRHPELYAVYSDYYRQDPAARRPRSNGR